MALGSLTEALSIGAVYPFILALTKPENLFNLKFFQPLIQLLNITENRQLQFAIALFFAIVSVLAGSIRLLLLWASVRLSHAIGSDMNNAIYKKTLYQPYMVHINRKSSEVIAGIVNKSNQVILSTVLPVLTTISASFILISIISALVAISANVAVVAFSGFGSIYFIVYLLTKNRLTINGRRYNEGVTKVIEVLQGGLGSIRDVLLHGSQESYLKIYREADRHFRRADANIAILGNSPRYIIETFSLVLLAGLAFNLSGLEDGGVVLMPVLGAIALGSIRLLSVLQQIYSAWASIRGSSSALQDVLGLLEQPLPEHLFMPQAEPMQFSKSIVLRDVGFRYQQNGPDVLTALNLEIPKGSRLGLVGATGCGKSTLIDILMGLLRPTNGFLEIDGESVSEGNLHTWQMHIAHVPQAIFLSDASVMENIAFGIPVKDIDIDRVRLAAEQAQISETIERWNRKYETRVGERGVLLSGGQRQRIGIARALYKRADVIVFDEATSALDTNTEEAVMRAIDGLSSDLTVIMIAHRLTTLKGCSHIVELLDGRVNRVGTYAEVLGTAPPK